MTNVEKYLEYREKWSEAFCNEDFDKYEQLVTECGKWLDEHFTKSDWEELIAKSYGREKYAYKMSMKKQFPD